MPLISVIVPVYNAEKTLRQCVDSVLMQEYKDFELILVDDGSKDDSLVICDEYAKQDTRVRVFHKENGGVSSARNLGLDNAKGEWITFIDSDDYITDGYLDGVTGCDEDILINSYLKFDNHGTVEELTSDELERKCNLKEFIDRYVTNTLLRGPVFKFYRKEKIKDLRFLLDMKIGEDAWFVFKYLARCQNHIILHEGDYMVRLAEKPDEVKYAITVDYAIQSLRHLQDAFDEMAQAHGTNKGLFLSYIGYFKRISKSDWYGQPKKWWRNKNVLSFYRYVWPALSLKQKIRLVVARILRR